MISFSDLASRSLATSNLIFDPNPELPGVRSDAGSALVPSLSFTNDVDTGLYNAGPNILGVSVGGTPTMMVASSNVVVGCDMTVSSNILPKGNAVQDIGSATMHFRSAWIDTLHISQNTLYLGDTPVLGTEQDSIAIRADVDQSINLKTIGLGETNITSVNGVNVVVTGLNSVVDIQSSGVGGRVVMGAMSEVAMNSPVVTVQSNLVVQGNLTVQGNNFTVNAQTVEVKDNILRLNAGQVGTGVSAGTAGFTIDRGDDLDYQLLFDESVDKFKIGPQGSLLPIATENYVNTSIFNASNITTGTLTVARGGTGTTTSTGTGSVVLSSNAVLDGPAINNATSLNMSSGVILCDNKTATNANQLRLWGSKTNYTIQTVDNGALDHLRLGTDGSSTIVITNNNSVGVGVVAPVTKFQVAGGDIYASGGSVIASSNIVGFSTVASDSNIKCAFEPISNALEKLKTIGAYTFQYRADADGRRHAGVIAQEVQQVLPEVVSKHPLDGSLTVAYGNMSSLLLAGLQELSEEVRSIKQRLDKM
jgi:hypothetical protein